MVVEMLQKLKFLLYVLYSCFIKFDFDFDISYLYYMFYYIFIIYLYANYMLFNFAIISIFILFDFKSA